MDGLRSQARETSHQKQAFLSPHMASQLIFPFITIRKFPTAAATYDESRFRANEIVTHAHQPIGKYGDQDATASLRVVRFDGEVNGLLNISQETFMDLFESFHLDPYCLYLIQKSVYGSYQFQRPILPASAHSLHTFYITTVSHSLIWSHNTAEASTKLIVIPWAPSDGFRSSDVVFQRFLTAIKYHKDLIDHPRFCSFICGTELVLWLDDFIGGQHPNIRDIEAETGHGTWKKGGQEKVHLGTGELAELSKRTGVILSALANVTRHASVANSLFQDLKLPSHSAASEPASSESKIAEAVALLESRVESAELYSSYLQERARTQQTVIFNLLSREDANANIGIAIAAKKDSSAMRTIAVMTMAFLPATFFAALFAIPLLQWQADTVMTDRFWVYWAFTLPCTALVFSIWWLLTVRKEGEVIGPVDGKEKDTREGCADQSGHLYQYQRSGPTFFW